MHSGDRHKQVLFVGHSSRHCPPNLAKCCNTTRFILHDCHVICSGLFTSAKEILKSLISVLAFLFSLSMNRIMHRVLKQFLSNFERLWTTAIRTSSSAMAERPRELDQRFQMGVQFEAIIQCV